MRVLGRIFLFFLFIFPIFSLKGEYRAYQYHVSSKKERFFDPRPHLIVSTLDPISYVAYHGGEESIKVELIRTWICRGHTGEREVCRPPFESFLQRFGL